MTVTNTVTGAGSGGLTGTIAIGDLTDLSGELQAIGSQQKIAVGLAITHINNYLTAEGVTSYKFATITEDTALNPATALPPTCRLSPLTASRWSSGR